MSQSKEQYRIGIVGATGAVGQELLQLLIAHGFPAQNLTLLASARSKGKQIRHAGHHWIIQEVNADAFDGLDIALFCASGSLSLELAPEAVARKCLVIDNSSAFRQDPKVPLVIPEINPQAAREHKGLIANPNCSTAIALMGLYPLHQAFGLKRFFASTYQAVSGSGVEGIRELEQQVMAWANQKHPEVSTYPHPIAFNVLPHVDVFYEDGYTKEEYKMVNESRKIMGLGDLAVSTTCVRVPVLRAHSIAIQAEFHKPVDVEAAREAIRGFAGAELVDDPANNRYPMPIDFSGKEKCGVGRLRKDLALENGLALWVSGDQLLKGAALNALQIAELVIDQGWVSWE